MMAQRMRLGPKGQARLAYPARELAPPAGRLSRGVHHKAQRTRLELATSRVTGECSNQ